MKLTPALGALALAITLPLNAAPPPDSGLRTANDREVAAFMATDGAALAALWSDDFLVTNPLNQVATKAQVLGMVQHGMLSFKSYSRRIEHVQHYGNIAIVVGSESVEWSGKMPLAGSPKELRFTSVWFMSKRGWQQVARHANIVPDNPK